MKIMIHKFVTFIPNKLEENILYISFDYCTVVHKCCCGCGNEVVTPLSPTDWQFTFDGESISLYPSIGNWNFECKSHYWIKNNNVIWAQQWSEEDIKLGRQREYLEKIKYYTNKTQNQKSDSNSIVDKKHKKTKRLSRFWSQLKKWW